MLDHRLQFDGQPVTNIQVYRDCLIERQHGDIEDCGAVAKLTLADRTVQIVTLPNGQSTG